MNTVTETPSLVVLFGTIILCSIVIALQAKRTPLIDQTLRSSFVAAVVYTIFDSIVRGVSAFIVIGFGDVFLLYLPIGFIACGTVKLIRRYRTRRATD